MMRVAIADMSFGLEDDCRLHRLDRLAKANLSSARQPLIFCSEASLTLERRERVKIDTLVIGYYDYHLMTLMFACFIIFQREKRELEIII